MFASCEADSDWPFGNTLTRHGTPPPFAHLEGCAQPSSPNPTRETDRVFESTQTAAGHRAHQHRARLGGPDRQYRDGTVTDTTTSLVWDRCTYGLSGRYLRQWHRRCRSIGPPL